MKKAIVLLVVALAIPTSVAFAKASPTRGKSNPGHERERRYDDQ